MSDDLTPLQVLLSAVEIGFWVVGVIVLWRVSFGDAARDRPSRALPFWTVSMPDFLLLAVCVFTGAWIGQLIAATLHAHTSHLGLLLQGGVFQLGMLVGVSGAWLLNRSHRTPPGDTAPEETPTRHRPHPLTAATGVFLIAIPLVTWIGYAWKKILQAGGFDVSEQELVDVFRQSNSPFEIVSLTLLAVVVAPLTEELIFRAGLFRYLNGRAPRWIALLVPSALFAVLHGNTVAFLPLLLLGVLFSLAYERTGRISVTIIAHGLFNLHTILLLLAGLTD